MLDSLYDNVLSIMTEKGFITWFEKNQQNYGKTSPLKWCYNINGELKSPPKPPTGINWVSHTYDSHFYHPHTIKIDDNGFVGPH